MSRRGSFSLLLIAGLIAVVCLSAGCLGEDAHHHPPAPPPPFDEDVHDWIFIGSGDQTVDTRLSEGLHLLRFHVRKPPLSYPDDSVVKIMTAHTGCMIRGSFTSGAYEAAEDGGWYGWSQAVMLPEGGNATIEVRQQGDWSLTLQPPAMINGIPPQTFAGVGNAATPFFMIPAGDYSCEIGMAEGTVLGVHLIRSDGRPLMEDDQQVPLKMHALRDADDILSIGSYTTTVPVTIHDDDTYLFNIISDGIWSVTISSV